MLTVVLISIVDYGNPFIWGALNTGTSADLSDWAIENGSSASCQSLLFPHSGSLIGSNALWGDTPTAGTKRSFKQFLAALLSKKSKNKLAFHFVKL